MKNDKISVVNLSDNEDLECVAKVRLGDAEAFEPLVRKYHPRIISFCADMLRDRSRGEDAAQDVFIKAFAKLNSFRGDASFKGWLYRIARNHCLDLIRSTKRRAEVSIDDQPEESSGLMLSAQIAASDLLTHILGAISPGHREVLLFREFYNLSYDEIANVLGVTVNAVKGRLKRARIEVQETMRHLDGDESVNRERGTTNEPR